MHYVVIRKWGIEARGAARVSTDGFNANTQNVTFIRQEV